MIDAYLQRTQLKLEQSAKRFTRATESVARGEEINERGQAALKNSLYLLSHRRWEGEPLPVTESERLTATIGNIRGMLSAIEAVDPTTRISFTLSIQDICVIQWAYKLHTGAFLRLDDMDQETLREVFDCFEFMFPTPSWDDLYANGLLLND